MIDASYEQTVKTLKPYQDKIAACIQNGFSEFEEKYNSDSYKLEIRTKSNIIRDLIVDNAKKDFLSDNKITFIRQNHYTLMNVDNKCLLRFKKLKPNLTSSNYATQQALNFSLQLEIPGLPPAPTRLDVGYVPDPVFSKIEGIYVVCLNGKKPKWSIQLDISDADRIENEMQFEEYSVPSLKVRLKENLKRRKGAANE